jgi:hypothetical protein
MWTSVLQVHGMIVATKLCQIGCAIAAGVVQLLLAGYLLLGISSCQPYHFSLLQHAGC